MIALWGGPRAQNDNPVARSANPATAHAIAARCARAACCATDVRWSRRNGPFSYIPRGREAAGNPTKWLFPTKMALFPRCHGGRARLQSRRNGLFRQKCVPLSFNSAISKSGISGSPLKTLSDWISNGRKNRYDECWSTNRVLDIRQGLDTPVARRAVADFALFVPR